MLAKLASVLTLAHIKSWMQQGTSILGASGATTAILAWSTGAMTGKMAISCIAGSLISFAMPQVSKVDATAVAGAIVNKLTAGPPEQPVGAAPVAILAKTL